MDLIEYYDYDYMNLGVNFVFTYLLYIWIKNSLELIVRIMSSLVTGYYNTSVILES